MNEIIPIVLTTDKNFIAYTAVTLYSIIKNSKDVNKYEVIVFCDEDFDKNIVNKFEYLVKNKSNFNIRFINIKQYFEKYSLKSNLAHVTNATFYRYIIPDVLKEYDKVIYLDTDMVINTDIAELYSEDVGNCYFGACHCSIVMQEVALAHKNIACLEMPSYFKKIGFDDICKDYFNAGVLIFNNKLMREDNLSSKMLEIAQNGKFIHSGQDPMNIAAKGKVKFLNMSWNLETWAPTDEDSISYIPENHYKEYIAALENTPNIIHYASFVKPWLDPGSFLAEYWWDYAKNTPFYELILRNMLEKDCKKSYLTKQEFCKLGEEKKLYRKLFKYKLISYLRFGYVNKKNKEKMSKLKASLDEICEIKRRLGDCNE